MFAYVLRERRKGKGQRAENRGEWAEGEGNEQRREGSRERGEVSEERGCSVSTSSGITLGTYCSVLLVSNAGQ